MRMTLISKLIVTAIVLITFATTATVFSGCVESDWRKAEKDAKEFASKIPNSTGDVSCAHRDTDQDGYCACSAFMKDGSVQPLECGCNRICLFCVEGCKVPNQLKVKGVR